MDILIKGAGDLATGIAVRLYHCGYSILMTEIEVPLTVRRMVAFSRAVYEGEAVVEGITGVRVHNPEEIRKVQQEGKIPVLVDPEAAICAEYQPDVLIDAILAKKNLGTKVTDAPFVIGVGPGFTAGVDCHCVVETKRGHTLGNVIFRGTAIPNTGIPGNVGGYTIERLLKATAAGVMEPIAEIGDLVQKGDIVAYTGGKPVYAKMTGIVRGMLQQGVVVTEDLKIGDIDARCEYSHCFTISDKARAIGGGVLEAVVQFERIYRQYAVIVLAAGSASRFGSNKLLADVQGKPLYRYMIEKLERLSAFPRILVTGYEEIAEAAEKIGVCTVLNQEPELGISHSLKLGLEQCRKRCPSVKGVLFSVCDQPALSLATMMELPRLAINRPGMILVSAHGNHTGNPVLWDQIYFSELEQLSGDIGGKSVMERHLKKRQLVEIGEEELKDIDRKVDLDHLNQ